MNAFLSTCRTAGVILSFSALGYGGFKYGVKFGNMDPFAKFRGINSIDMRTGIELNKVGVKEYHLGKLVVQAQVKRITVSQDRANLDMVDIHDGIYKGGRAVHFAADNGQLNLASENLRLGGLARVAGSDFDIQTKAAAYNRLSQKLSVPGPLSGKLMGGTFRASQFEYATQSGDASAHLVHWQGKPPSIPEAQGQTDIVAHSWEIDCDYTEKKGVLSIYKNAKATDGEVLIYAPKVEQDRATDVLTGTGRITYFSGKADVVADKVVIYRKEKRAVFTGNVVMLVKSKKDEDKPPAQEKIPSIKSENFNEKFKLPEKQSVITPGEKEKAETLRSGKNVRDYPLHLQAQEITYWYGKGNRHAIFGGSPVARQDFPSGQWRMGWSFDGTYDGEKDILNLTSESDKRQVRYKNSVGDIAQASKAIFSTKDTETEDDEDLKFWDSSAIYTDSSGEDTRPPKGKADSKTATATSPTDQKPPPPPPPSKSGPG
jgi:hypothetical protein